MPTLLLEIGCEELPAGFCDWAERELRDRWIPAFGGTGRALVGPRRIAMVVDGFDPEAGGEERRGPGEGVAYSDGRPTRAAEGFARTVGLSVDELVVREGYVWGRLPPRPLPDRLWQVVTGLGAGKTMIWETAERIRFPRPIRWLCAKLDAETVEVGPAAVPSADVTFGHRFRAGQLEVPDAASYEDLLAGAGVVADSARRRALIVEGLDRLGAWRDPGRVLDEVVHLAEDPTVLDGDFDERFLRLPERVIVTAMQSHQRYFPLGGNRFAFVANGGDPAVVRSGNELVLEGRLDDAAFAFDRDLATGIEGLVERLGAITFFEGAGTLADKSGRLIRLVERLGGGDASREAARLAKADHASELVREFAELEGSVGAEYARAAGFPEAVAVAIEEHYLPDSATGSLPATEAGKVLAAADRIDTLTVAFDLGHRPTGSRDPYGLRRAAIGLCRLAREGGLRIERALLEPGVREFVEERLEALLDVPVEAVRAAVRSPVSDLGGAAALAEFLGRASDGDLDRAHTAYTRAARLAGNADAGDVDPALLSEDAERELVERIAHAEPRIRDAVEDGRFADALSEVGDEVAPAVDRFFDDVLVMADDRAVRENRLRILLAVRDALGVLGDLSQLPR